MKPSNYIRWSLIVLGSIVGLVYLGVRLRTSPQNVLSYERVILCVPRSESSALVRVAHAKKFFSAEGLEVIIREQEESALCLKELTEKNSELAVVFQEPLVKAAFSQVEYRILASVFSHEPEGKLLGRLDHGVTSPADLAGKKVGIISGGREHLLASFLFPFGIESHEVQLHTFAEKDLWQALDSGKVDAIAVRGASAPSALAKSLQRKMITVVDKPSFTNTANLVAAPGWIKAKPQVASALLRALLKAEQWTQDHPDEVLSLVADAVQVEMESLRAIWPRSRFRVTLEQGLLLSLESKSRVHREQNFKESHATPNYLSYIEPGPLSEVKPSAVQIIH